MNPIHKFMNDISIKGLICLDAGTGTGGMTRYLVRKGAKFVYSVSNNEEYLDYARSNCSTNELRKIKFINTDLSDLNFLSVESVNLITAHMLINLVSPIKLFLIFKELTRAARKGCLLIIIDYNPFFTYQMDRSYLIEELFRIENAIHYLVEGEPAMIWYPSEYIIIYYSFWAGN
ncbi:MAG TPA: class I SAM-dependent methyltransferase [Caldisericia bacterium]|jgi:ubiquinone/menaquinone biosynthesis C-methylase UbiE|nr:class I SAM-dependent methyltransferase [Caldisericia bacterium]HPB33200.1 class I SAM-dependent methyltransferase [Caldisericia bacterium]HQL66709.1 class I SAM-dependent methyltransferase [Caldisericia bacterium]HQN47974.1 class I SAM-dependent methyltransferase [Caldisericia bacterium]HQO99058.1 class I SAM-dependent methyltransferase [Caldisericia bacterium]